MERVLVCILAQTRAHQVAWPRFKRHVLDELDADLALAVTLDEEYDYLNPYWQHAKYKWTSYQPPDIGDAWDLAQRWLADERGIETPPDWRIMLRVKGIWQGGIKAPDPQRSFSSNLVYARWLLVRGLHQDGILDRYDRFVVTRSDFVWLCPHPPMSILDRDSLWFPDGEYWGGISDRHLIVSRENVVDALNIIDDILLRPDALYEEVKHFSGMNLETFLKNHLERRDLFHKVEVFPYVMYTARPTHDPKSRGGWSRGWYNPALGHYVKYPEELRSARAYATVIKTREDWETGVWKDLDWRRAASEYRPTISERISGALQVSVSGLRRPGRVDRFRRFMRERVLKKPA